MYQKIWFPPKYVYTPRLVIITAIDPFRTAVPFWGQTTYSI